MKALFIVFVPIVGFFSGCLPPIGGAQARPTAILFSYNGLPRANEPKVFWFPGKELPIVPDAYVESKVLWRAAPKVSLSPEVFRGLCELLEEASSTEESPYVIEWWRSDGDAHVTFVDSMAFQKLRKTIEEREIEAGWILFHWPVVTDE